MGIVANSRVQLRWPQQQAVGLGGAYRVYAGVFGGPVNYAAALHAAPIVAWPDGATKAGLGLGRSGYGPLGFGELMIGLGLGMLGLGRLGFGAAGLAFRTPPLADAGYRFAVVSCDEPGNPDPAAGGKTADTMIIGTPRPPKAVRATMVGEAIGLSWTRSPDDEG